MNIKTKLKKVCLFCDIHFEVARNRKTQKFCSRDCAAHSVRRHVPNPSGIAKMLWVRTTGPRRWSKDRKHGPDKRNPPFHRSSEEVTFAVQEYLASGGKVTTLPSPSVTKDAEIVAGGSDLEEVRQVTKPLNRDRSIMKGHLYRD